MFQLVSNQQYIERKNPTEYAGFKRVDQLLRKYIFPPIKTKVNSNSNSSNTNDSNNSHKNGNNKSSANISRTRLQALLDSLDVVKFLSIAQCNSFEVYGEEGTISISVVLYLTISPIYILLSLYSLRTTLWGSR